MVLDFINDLAMTNAAQFLAGLVLGLTGLNHIFMPGEALVAQILNMVAEFIGLASGSGLIVGISFIAGFAVLSIGLGQIGMVLEDMDVY